MDPDPDDLDLDDHPPPTPARRALRMARDVLVSVVVLVIVIAGVGWARAPELPAVAPAFTLQDLDGRPVSLASFAGRTVVLNFWATWCGPCRMEAPTFAAFAEAHPDVVVLGIAADGSPAELKRASAELGITYPVLRADAAVLAAYAIGTYPTTVFVAPDGSVRWSHTGLLLRPELAWVSGKLW